MTQPRPDRPEVSVDFILPTNNNYAARDDSGSHVPPASVVLKCPGLTNPTGHLSSRRRAYRQWNERGARRQIAPQAEGKTMIESAKWENRR
jgi:hypothetical protein